MGSDPRMATPPSRVTARVLTVVSLLFPLALPAAIFYTRRARQEATAGRVTQRRRLIDRPLIFYVVFWFTFLALVFVLMGVLSVVFDVSPV